MGYGDHLKAPPAWRCSRCATSWSSRAGWPPTRRSPFELVQRILEVGGAGVVAMKDPTRGGVASALQEMAKAGVGILLDEGQVPVSEAARAASELLGSTPSTSPMRAKPWSASSPRRPSRCWPPDAPIP